MTNQELIKYLEQFPADEHVGVIALDLDKRLAYRIGSYQLMTDAGGAVLLIEVENPEPLDDVVEQTQ